MMAIRQLDPIVASRIAAGEVVERPSSVLRELLDNSIDAGADKISVHVTEGGIRNLTVVDNGCGMSKEDLPLACISHATSKITTIDDLFNLKTLGFRGEALSSIAACSVLTINSNGWKITVDNGSPSAVMPGSIQSGTSVSMDNLFENIPARKLFLKRASSETTECRKTFLEKALGFPETEFLFFCDGELKLRLEKADRKKRILDVLALDKDFDAHSAIEMGYDGDDVKLYAVSSDSSCYRRDRSRIKILVNNRVIDSYQLVQAITSAYSAALPGGAFPYFHLFIDDNPALVDFNIHPAKRECKIRNQSQIYGHITTMIRQALLRKNTNSFKEDEAGLPGKNLFGEITGEKTPEQYKAEPSIHNFRMKPQAETHQMTCQIPVRNTEISQQAQKPVQSKPFDPSWFQNAKAIMSKNREKTEKQINEETRFKYLGQAFNTYLIVQTENDVLFIDQHAAHERILYDEIRSLRDVQRLIVPYRFETDRSVDDFLLENSVIYSDFGVELTRVEPMLWEMSTIPAACRKNEQQIASYIQTATGDIESAQKGLFAVIACHAAIKAGDPIDSVTANALLEKVFALDAMLCPHGRSFTFVISKKELDEKVGRTL